MSIDTPRYDRAAAWAIVTEWTTDPALIRHMLSVETAMRAYAPRYDGDPDTWGIVGLIHDFDYQRHPNLDGQGHPNIGIAYLRDLGWPEVVLHAIAAHAPELTGVAPDNNLERVLIAVDELTGFIAAVAFVRPSRNVADVQVSSIRKKWKEKAFAAGVHRDEIERAADALGVPLDEHIAVVLKAMQDNAAVLGLNGARP
jgi:predicted hydrolase (HD superfamily)